MSSTFNATRSQPRSLPSIDRLNIARSRILPSNCNSLRIDQTCFGRSGGFAPVSFPLFQGKCLDVAGISISRPCMAILLYYRGGHLAPAHFENIAESAFRVRMD